MILSAVLGGPLMSKLLEAHPVFALFIFYAPPVKLRDRPFEPLGGSFNKLSFSYTRVRTFLLLNANMCDPRTKKTL